MSREPSPAADSGSYYPDVHYSVHDSELSDERLQSRPRYTWMRMDGEVVLYDSENYDAWISGDAVAIGEGAQR
jgi:hypothetical protein